MATPIAQWADPTATWNTLVASGHAPVQPARPHICGQHVECLSIDEDFPTCVKQGCVHAWPFDDLPASPSYAPEIFDRLAVYLPLHAYGPTSWGVWLHADRLTAYADRIADLCRSPSDPDVHPVHLDVFDIVARHAQYHHLAEAAITAFELYAPANSAPWPPPDVAPLFDAPEPMEELLANAWAFQRARAHGSAGHRTRECLMQRVRAQGSPGYSDFDLALEPMSFATIEMHMMGRRGAWTFETRAAPSEYERVAQVPVYLWGTEAARRAVCPAARNAVLGPLTGTARYAGKPAGSVSDERRGEIAEGFRILRVLGDLHVAYAFLFNELDFDAISAIRTHLIASARAAKGKHSSELDPLVLEIDAFEKASRWATLDDAI